MNCGGSYYNALYLQTGYKGCKPPELKENLEKMETMLENLLREEAAVKGIQELYSCLHNQGSLRAM